MKEPIGWLLVALSLTLVAQLASDRPTPPSHRTDDAATAGLLHGNSSASSVGLDDLCWLGNLQHTEWSTVIAADRKSNRLRVYRPTGELLHEIRIGRPGNPDQRFDTAGSSAAEVAEPELVQVD